MGKEDNKRKANIWISSNEVDETGAYYTEWSKPEGKTKKEKGKGREEEGRRCKNRLQNRQKFWDVGNFLQPQKLGNDVLEVIRIHH